MNSAIRQSLDVEVVAVHLAAGARMSGEDAGRRRDEDARRGRVPRSRVVVVRRCVGERRGRQSWSRVEAERTEMDVSLH